MRKSHLCALAVGTGIVSAAASSMAALQGTGLLVNQPLGGGLFQDTISIHNSGTTTIGTFWFAWFPATPATSDFLLTAPNTITSPAGWTSQVFGGGPGDGYSIQWRATSPSSYLASGGDLPGFGFRNGDSAATLQLIAPNNSHYHVTDSFFYIGAPETDPGYLFTVTVTSAPSPSGVALLGLGGLLVARRRRNGG